MAPRNFIVRPAKATELDDVAAFCAGRERDAKTREIKRRRRQWLQEAMAEGLTVLLALDPRPPATVEYEGERVGRDELTLLSDGLAVGLLEYVPVENTLYPVEGEGYIFIDCLWVIPPYLSRGVGRELMRAVLRAGRELETGVATVAWRGDQPSESWAYMPAPFFRSFGFDIADEDGDRVLMAVSFGATGKPVLVRPGGRDVAGWEFLCHPRCPASLWAAEQVAEAGEDAAVVELAGRDDVRRYGALCGICRDGRPILNRLAFGSDLARLRKKGNDHSPTD
ncbi:MAG: GNAT family N-acetyltransferase [Candidatus Zixiibacteriota bacterium]|jgi:GNAT superfamily N-acetyltransferase